MTDNSQAERIETAKAGLASAIAAAGSVATLAVKLGIKSPSISAWDVVPVKRVLAVAAATGVPRGELDPWTYPPGGRTPTQHPGANPSSTPATIGSAASAAA